MASQGWWSSTVSASPNSFVTWGCEKGMKLPDRTGVVRCTRSPARAAGAEQPLGVVSVVELGEGGLDLAGIGDDVDRVALRCQGSGRPERLRAHAALDRRELAQEKEPHRPGPGGLEALRRGLDLHCGACLSAPDPALVAGGIHHLSAERPRPQVGRRRLPEDLLVVLQEQHVPALLGLFLRLAFARGQVVDEPAAKLPAELRVGRGEQDERVPELVERPPACRTCRG